MSHWLMRAARRAGLPGADGMALPPGTPVAEAWETAADGCGVSPDRLAEALASALSLEVADFDTAMPAAVKLLPASLARKYGVFPLRVEDRTLLVATANPVDTDADQEVGFASGRSARLAVAPPGRIREAIDAAYAPDQAAASMLAQIDERFREAGDVSVDLAQEEAPEAVSETEVAAGPIVKLTNIVLHEAISRGSSDVHIQPMAGHGVVRFRTDGVLHNGMQVPLPVMQRIVSRIKIMARLDITDRLRPQDGRARIVIDGRKYDLRVSTVPTRQSEKAVIRVLDTQATGTLDDTGIEPDQVRRIRRALSYRDGIVVVTGPTGSGKTTTMYGALREIATEDINIMTVEDPVEYELPRLTQIQVEHRQGMTFASALRAILRQDPDVIFVGEIRDAETAEIAAQASLTGHLVLATLHTNDAVGSIRRFLDLGLDAGTVGETLRGALAQRLVRRVCPECAEPVGDALTAVEAELVERLGRRPPVRAVGCERCMGTGYAGRLPVTEFMVSTPELVGLMLAGRPAHELEKRAIADGMVPLLESALRRVERGETTLEEVERVVGAGEEAPGEAAGRIGSGGGAANGNLGGEPPIAGSNGAGPAAVMGRAGPALPGPARAAGSSGAHSSGSAAAGATRSLATRATGSLAAHSNGSLAAHANGSPAAHVADDASTGPDAVPDDRPHVLIVDDDGTTRSIARALVEKHLGFRVSTSPDGADALLRLARGEIFSLMVLDLDMPTLGGREVLRSVRQSIVTAGLPVVVLTGTADPEAEIELLEMGADDYLRKPLDPSRLQTRIKAALRRAQG